LGGSSLVFFILIMGKKIFLVDDDENILKSVSISLESEGFSVKTFTDGEKGLKGILEGSPDIAVLDIKMPRLNGIDLLKKIRNSSNVPVIFLTSKDTEIDELLGFKLGADDYIIKPFSQKVLIERIRVLIKRQEFFSKYKDAKNENSKTNSVIKGNFSLDKDKHMCKWKNKAINLTVTEFLIIQSLIENPGVVKSREQLMIAAFGEEGKNEDDRAIDHHLKRIRKKIKINDKKFNEISTIYGVGYKFSE